MESRESDLASLHSYIEGVDKEITMILQNLQWDRKHLGSLPMAICKYDAGHRIPPDKKEAHERNCFLSCSGYSKEDMLLPDPINPASSTLVKFGKDDIREILSKASSADPGFKTGMSCGGEELSEPLSLSHLQCTYTADERRALHDAAVAAAPACHDLSDLAMLSASGQGEKQDKTKSRLEVLAELRNMKRRRAKYRVAAKTTNYSDVLRDVIKTQMEFYSDAQVQVKQENLSDHQRSNKTSNPSTDFHSTNPTYKENYSSRRHTCEYSRDRHKDRSIIDKESHYKRSREDKDRHYKRLNDTERTRDRHRQEDKDGRCKEDNRGRHSKYDVRIKKEHVIDDHSSYRTKESRRNENESSRSSRKYEESRSIRSREHSTDRSRNYRDRSEKHSKRTHLDDKKSYQRYYDVYIKKEPEDY